MRVGEAGLVLSVIALAAFVGHATLSDRPLRTATAAGRGSDAGVLSVRSGPATHETGSVSLFGEAAGSVAFGSGKAASATPAVDPSFLRERVSRSSAGTYVDELLLSRDSALVRWPDRVLRPLRVWLARPLPTVEWAEDYVDQVYEAFDSWSGTGIPVRFSFITDSASADVKVHFVDRFPSGISGKTVWSRDANWWLLSGSIELAMIHPGGGAVTSLQMHAIALHEIGHLLGLDHSASEENIMAQQIRARALSESDVATVRLLYSVPAGTLRDVRPGPE